MGLELIAMELDVMYAIAFDIDTEIASKIWEPRSHSGMYSKIKTIMSRNGFEKEQGSLYFGNSNINIQDCHKVIKELCENVLGFKEAAKNIQLLQILDNSDLRYMLEWFTYVGK